MPGPDLVGVARILAAHLVSLQIEPPQKIDIDIHINSADCDEVAPHLLLEAGLYHLKGFAVGRAREHLP